MKVTPGNFGCKTGDRVPMSLCPPVVAASPTVPQTKARVGRCHGVGTSPGQDIQHAGDTWGYLDSMFCLLLASCAVDQWVSLEKAECF